VAIGLEFIDVVVPITRIREAYPGGWEQCLLDYAPLLGRRVWHDRHLFRDGALTPEDARRLVEGWSVLGFEPAEQRGGALHWKDLCVIQSSHGGPTRPCRWLAFDATQRIAHLAGTDPGPLAWRGAPAPV
jgi:hypothetical protein